MTPFFFEGLTPFFSFGIAGILGFLFAEKFAPLRPLRPPRFLLPLFAIVALFSTLDLVDDFAPGFYLFYRWHFGSHAEYVSPSPPSSTSSTGAGPFSFGPPGRNLSRA